MQAKTLFFYYSDHLKLLIDNGIVTIENYQYPLYICPLSLARYSDPDTPADNPLTLEDAPPKALGGKPVVLTNKKSNNTAGYKIDAHLVERLRELDDQKFLPGTDFPVIIKLGDETFRARIIVDDAGNISVTHSKKNNHPEKLEQAMKTLHKGEVITPEFVKSRVIPENLAYALLKSAYILAFRKYGYSLMLDPCYDIVREQLEHPEIEVYPSGFWFHPERGKYPTGVFFITQEGYESIMVVFDVDTGKTGHTFAVILPLPIRSVAEVISKISEKFEQSSQLELRLYPLEQVPEQFLTDLPNIKSMRKWIAERTPGWKA